MTRRGAILNRLHRAGLVRAPKLGALVGAIARLPIYGGLICAGFLLVGWFMEMRLNLPSYHYSVTEGGWTAGGYYQESYVAASLLLYFSLMSLAALPFQKRDERGFSVASLTYFLSVLWVFEYCFRHKLEGWILWPFWR